MTNSDQPMSRPIVCCICSGRIPSETSKTNERGNAVHEDCYVRQTISRAGQPAELMTPRTG